MTKFFLFLLSCLAFYQPGYAQSTISGTLTSSDPVIPNGQIARGGVAVACGVSKLYPGTLTSGGVHYRAFNLSGPVSATCVSVTYAPACSPGPGSDTFLTIYSGPFDPTNLATNYAGDIATSVGNGATASLSVNVPAGASYVVIVSGTTASTECSAYSITVSSGTIAPQPLPVELVSFAGIPTPTGTALTWTTATELANAYFVVERSADGERFTALGQVAGAGSSAQAHSYAYRDVQPPAGLSYYRLRQVDVDGSAHYSPVVAVQAVATAVSFSPNPVTDQATFTSPVATTLTVRDGLGRAVQVLPLTAGSQQISFSALPAGVYSLTDAATHHTLRLVKTAN